jgi:SAM-dependent methyltransferase
MHLNCQHLFAKYALDCFKNTPVVLEIGPDADPSGHRRQVTTPIDRWDTLELVQRSVPVTHIANSDYSFPIADDTYDIVLASNVIEHVRKIWRWLPELARVTRPGGFVIIINPVSWHHHGFPADCWRIYPDGMHALCEDSNLTVRLSRFENAQLSKIQHRFPRFVNRSHVPQRLSGMIGLFHKILRPLSFDGAFDTITIAQKPK